MLHKTGKPKNKTLSYEPLSLTSWIGKIFEKLLTNRIKSQKSKITTLIYSRMVSGKIDARMTICLNLCSQ